MNPVERTPRSIESNVSPYSKIPEMVAASLVENPKKAKFAHRSRIELLGILDTDPFLDSTFLAVVELQESILKPSNKKQLGDTKAFLDQVIAHGTKRDTQARRVLRLHISENVDHLIMRFKENDDKIKKKKLIDEKSEYSNIRNLIDAVNQQLPTARNNNQTEISFSLQSVGPNIDEKTLMKMQEATIAYNQWQASIAEILMNQDSSFYKKHDLLIELLKNQPQITPSLQKENIYTKKYGEISLEDIGKMKYPLSTGNFMYVLDFATQALSNTSDDLANSIFHELLFFPTFFSAPTTRYIDYKNHSLLANLNSWQELVSLLILFNRNQTVDIKLTEFLKKMPKGYGNLGRIINLAANPLDMDPQPESDMQKLIARHPVLEIAIRDYIKENNLRKMENDTYLDEIGHNYFNHKLVSRLEVRLKELGVYDLFEEEIRRLEERTKDNKYDKHHLVVVKEVFETTAGEEFIEKLNQHSSDIKEISQTVWQSALENMHFLPMEDGENIIEFSEGTIPKLLGLKSLRLGRNGTPQDWKLFTSYEFDNLSFVLLGSLTQEGKLICKGPLEEKIPGLYAILNHIAVLVFHDIVVQRKKEKENAQSKTDEHISPNFLQKIIDKLKPKQSKGNLPRTQKDTDLISDLYKNTGLTPRRVELHRAFLRGAKIYKEAVDAYNDARNKNASEEELKILQQQVEESGGKAYRISDHKKLSIPAKFTLTTIQDPITNELRHLETWVVEHTNPKPTDEELQSPKKLFERYYKNSSSLASLEQMKPWIIGQ